MSKPAKMPASKPHAFNRIEDLRKAPPKAAEKLGQRVENFAYPRPVFSRKESRVQ